MTFGSWDVGMRLVLTKAEKRLISWDVWCRLISWDVWCRLISWDVWCKMTFGSWDVGMRSVLTRALDLWGLDIMCLCMIKRVPQGRRFQCSMYARGVCMHESIRYVEFMCNFTRFYVNM